MKKLLLIAAIATGSLAFAQEGPGPKQEKRTNEQRAEKHVERLTNKLELSEEQKVKIYKIELESLNKTEAKRAEMHKIKNELRAERNATREEIEKELTPEQLRKLKVLEKERMEKRKQKHKNKKRPSRSPHLTPSK